ncbi:MAG: GLPGLI family protein [Candidatus Limimorpha sp.]
MRKIFFLTIIILCCISANAQYWFNEPIIELDTARLQVMYRLTYIEDTNHLNYKCQEKMILFTGDVASSFQPYNGYKFDKVGRQKRAEGTMIEWLSSGISSNEFISNFFFRIYKRQDDRTITTTDRVPLSASFKYEEKADAFNWEITEETAVIEGYMVQKACCDFGGRRWEAWFTPEIPYSEGPYKFCGLPGLILNIADTDGHYVFELLSIEVPEPGTMVEFLDRDDYVVSTKKEFFKAFDDNQKNLINTVKDNGGDAQMSQRISRSAKSKNNPIEIERE